MPFAWASLQLAKKGQRSGLRALGICFIISYQNSMSYSQLVHRNLLTLCQHSMPW